MNATKNTGTTGYPALRCLPGVPTCTMHTAPMSPRYGAHHLFVTCITCTVVSAMRLLLLCSGLVALELQYSTLSGRLQRFSQPCIGGMTRPPRPETGGLVIHSHARLAAYMSRATTRAFVGL